VKILVAEDDTVCRRVLEWTIEKLDHEVMSCADGTEAWESFGRSNPQMAILDWMMPGMDGPEVCRRIRETEKNRVGSYCYVIFLTARSHTEDLVEGIESGADDFMTKPFDRRELQARIQAGARILDLRDQLVEANKAKSEFMDMAVHDFGTPMSVIRSYLELFRDGLLGELNERQCAAVQRMLVTEHTLEGLRADMLELSRFEHDPLELKKEPVDIRELVQPCVEEVEYQARSKHLRVSADLPRLEFVCDERRVRQAIGNYLSNAVRYTAEGGTIRVTAARQNGHVQVSVADTGRGIASEDLENVFVGFYRSGKKVDGSTGLGLAVVRKVVEAHGGRAWCESELGKGSTFHFTIPTPAT
jgi:signal transduction histidine kinase